TASSKTKSRQAQLACVTDDLCSCCLAAPLVDAPRPSFGRHRHPTTKPASQRRWPPPASHSDGRFGLGGTWASAGTSASAGTWASEGTSASAGTWASAGALGLRRIPPLAPHALAAAGA